MLLISDDRGMLCVVTHSWVQMNGVFAIVNMWLLGTDHVGAN